MKKIMFNDRYCLTDLVLSGQKTQTRRIVKIQYKHLNHHITQNFKYAHVFTEQSKEDKGGVSLSLRPMFYIGEVVAVAQSYKKAYPKTDFKTNFKTTDKLAFMTQSAGWKNKMFIKPDLMPHTIKINNIRFEKLQDLNDEDCIKEGVLKSDKYAMPYGIPEKAAPNGIFFYYKSPQEAYADLMDKINGIGTWESNPYVWVYDFELVK